MEKQKPVKLEEIPHPAFIARAGVIIKANEKAIKLNVKKGTPVETIIFSGLSELREFKKGRLCLSVVIDYEKYHASVFKYRSNQLLFCIDSEHICDKYVTLQTAIAPMNDPIQCAILAIEKLRKDVVLKQNPSIIALNHQLYRLTKIIADINDSARSGKTPFYQTTKCDAISFASEITQRTSKLFKEMSPKLKVSFDKTKITDELHGDIDKVALERLILTTLSALLEVKAMNAPVRVNIEKKDNRMVMTFQCKTEGKDRGELESIFISYCNIPDALDIESDFLRGAPVIRNTITTLCGSLLIEISRGADLRFIVSIPIENRATRPLQSNIQIPYALTGSLDHYLTIFSELLPDSMYK